MIRKTLLVSAALFSMTAAAAMAQAVGVPSVAPSDTPIKGPLPTGTAPVTSPGVTPAPSSVPSKPATPLNRRHIVRPVHRVAAPQGGDIRPGHVPGVGDSYPLSGKASNITPGDTRSTIAPTLPSPPGGQNASVRTFLSDAQRALDRGQTGTAQEALERAETAMLQRSVPVNQAGTPDQAPDVQQVTAARDALSRHDLGAAKQAVAAAMSAGS